MYLLNVWCLILTSSLSSAGPQKAREKTSHKTQTCFAWSLVQKLTELLSLLRRHLNLLWQLDEEWRRPRHSGGQERWKTVTIKTKFHGIRSQSFISCDYAVSTSGPRAASLWTVTQLQTWLLTWPNQCWQISIGPLKFVFENSSSKKFLVFKTRSQCVTYI